MCRAYCTAFYTAYVCAPELHNSPALNFQLLYCKCVLEAGSSASNVKRTSKKFEKANEAWLLRCAGSALFSFSPPPSPTYVPCQVNPFLSGNLILFFLVWGSCLVAENRRACRSTCAAQPPGIARREHRVRAIKQPSKLQLRLPHLDRLRHCSHVGRQGW